MMKSILLTFTVTMSGVAIAATLFLNTILSTFGLVSTSVDTFNSLKSSQIVMEKMQNRHQIKKRNITNKLAKRSGRRIASASLAAATIGTVAVAATMTGFEIHDYCEEQASLQIEHNILYGGTTEFDFDTCLEQGQIESARILADVKQSTSDMVTEVMHSATDYSHQQWLALKAAYMTVIESTASSIGTFDDALK